MRRFGRYHAASSSRPELFPLMPGLYVVAMYMFAFMPETFVSLVPDFRWKNVDDRAKILTTPSYIAQLVTAKIRITEVHRLKQLGSLNAEAETAEVDFILRECAAILRENETLFTEHLLKDVSMSQLTGEGVAGTLSKAAGLLTLTNVLWLIAIIMGVASVAAIIILFHEHLNRLVLDPLMLLVRFVIRLIRNTPPEIHLFTGYVVCFAFHVIGKSVHSTASEFLALTGGIGAAAMFFASTYVHFGTGGNHDKRQFATILQAFLALTWAPAAVVFDSSIFGFMTCLAVLGLLGFMTQSQPLCIVIGFEDDDALIRATMAALMMMLSFSGLRVAGGIRSPFPGAANAAAASGLTMARLTRPFELGCLFMGTFVYFLGLLIGSSKYYRRNWSRPSDYTRMNILALLSGFFALYVGNVYNVGPLNGVGGTFFMLWLLQKYGEMASLWRNGMWPFGLAGLSLFIYLFSFFIHSHPEYVLSVFDTPSTHEASQSNLPLPGIRFY